MNKSRIYLLLPLRCIAFLAIFLIGAAVTGKATDEISSCWSIVASAFNIVTILILVFAAKKNNTTYAELINYRKGQPGVKKVILLAILFTFIGMAGMYLAGFVCYGTLMPAVSLKIIAPIPKVLAVLNLLILPITTALAEDGLYLGAGVGQIRNKYAAIIIPAFFYAFQHCFIPTIFDMRYMAYRFLSFLPLTVIFCIYFSKKREPLPVMTGHVLLDLATAFSILATSVIPGAYEKWGDML